MKSQLCLALAIVGAGLLGSLPSPAATGYVAHEWGTFTSIQGSDGALLNWSGVETGELPAFVYSTARPGLGRMMSLLLAKTGVSALQRMETPVIYFYTDQAVRANVTVQFPQGLITEWYPQARDIGPGLQDAITNSLIRWNDFEILPVKRHPDLTAALPTAKRSSHYFAARETEAALVRVASMEKTNPAPEFEKFLFYRGVGNFHTALTTTISETEEITLTNSGSAPLKHLFALEVRDGRAVFTALGDLSPAQTTAARLDLSQGGLPLADAVMQLSRQMADALASEGLYRAEAEAMVKTWHDAWFEEQGLRILYVLPRTWTDRILPITLEPQPRELVRVMVGRSELITPKVEAQLRDLVTRFRESGAGAREDAARRLQALGLGRFAPMALRYATRSSTDLEVQKAVVELIQAVRPAQATAATAVQPAAARLVSANGG